MSVKPRPEFGKPETGLVRHWYRTDAQMRRAMMSPEQRAIEAQRIGDRRRQMKKARAEAEEFKRRVAHRHTLCFDCGAGLADVGVVGKIVPRKREVEPSALVCCVCLSETMRDTGEPKSATWGPRREAFRCRVLEPESPEETVEVFA